MVYSMFPVDVIVTYRFTIEDKLCTKQRSSICCNGPSKGEVSLDGAVNSPVVALYAFPVFKVTSENITASILLRFLRCVKIRAWNAIISVIRLVVTSLHYEQQLKYSKSSIPAVIYIFCF